MPVTILEKLKNKEVEVRASGFLYRGILKEVTSEEITLVGPTGFVSIPMERILSVKDPSAKKSLSDQRYVDPSFYNADLIDPQPKKAVDPAPPTVNNEPPEE